MRDDWKVGGWEGVGFQGRGWTTAPPPHSMDHSSAAIMSNYQDRCREGRVGVVKLTCRWEAVPARWVQQWLHPCGGRGMDTEKSIAEVTFLWGESSETDTFGTVWKQRNSLYGEFLTRCSLLLSWWSTVLLAQHNYLLEMNVAAGQWLE